jgi:O-antigen ligase
MRMTIFFQLMIMSWLIWQVTDRPKLQRSLLMAYVYGGYFSVAGTFLNYISRSQVEGSYDTRYTANGFDPNELGVTLVIAIPLAWHLSMKLPSRLSRWICLLYIPLATTAVILTASRTAFIVLVFSFLYIGLTLIRMKGPRKWAMLLLLAAGLGVLTQTVDMQSAIDRLSSTGDQLETGNISSRGEIWKAGLDMFEERPLLGVGIGNFAAMLERQIGFNQVAHNVFLTILVESGLVGLAVYVLVVAALWRAAMRYDAERRRMWLFVCLIWLAACFALSWDYSKPTWLLFSIIGMPTENEAEPDMEPAEDAAAAAGAADIRLPANA